MGTDRKPGTFPELMRRQRLALMSGPGQTRHFERAPTTSGLPSTTDLSELRERVRLVPISDIDHGWRLSQRGS